MQTIFLITALLTIVINILLIIVVPLRFWINRLFPGMDESELSKDSRWIKIENLINLLFTFSDIFEILLTIGSASISPPIGPRGLKKIPYRLSHLSRKQLELIITSECLVFISLVTVFCSLTFGINNIVVNIIGIIGNVFGMAMVFLVILFK